MQVWTGGANQTCCNGLIVLHRALELGVKLEVGIALVDGARTIQPGKQLYSEVNVYRPKEGKGEV